MFSRSGNYAHACPSDGSPCTGFLVEFGFGACIVVDKNGNERFVCPRLVSKSKVAFGFIAEDLVPKELICAFETE
jgi:hypothetical protein